MTPATRTEAVDAMETHVSKMEARLAEWGAKLHDLAARADDAGEAAKVDYRERLAELEAKHHAAGLKLDELKAAGGERWLTFKTGVENAWAELELAFENLTN